MKPPSVYDYPVWDSSMPSYVVFVGVAGGVTYPIVYIDDNGVHMVAHGTTEVYTYKDGTIVKQQLEGSWVDASQSVIDQTGLQMVAASFKFESTFVVTQIEARLMIAN